MAINNVPYFSSGVNMPKRAEKSAEVTDEEKIRQEERASALQKLQEKRKADYENAMTDSPLGAEAVRISGSVE